MKARFINLYAVLCMGLCCSGLCQTTFILSNRILIRGVNAPVFDASGIPLEGTNYLAELYGGAAPDALTPATADMPGGGRMFVAFNHPGYFSPTYPYVAIAGVPLGGYAWLQVRAWDARLGTTYEEAAAHGLGGYGESPLFYARGGGDGAGVPSIARELIGLQPFRLRPSTTAALMRSVRHQGDQVVIEWNPGFQRYQLQQTTAVTEPWQNVGAPTTATSLTNSISGQAQFFRVIGLFQ